MSETAWLGTQSGSRILGFLVFLTWEELHEKSLPKSSILPCASYDPSQIGSGLTQEILQISHMYSRYCNADGLPLSFANVSACVAGFGFPALVASDEALVSCLERSRWHREEFLACFPTGVTDLVCSQGKESHHCRINIHMRQRVTLNRIMLPNPVLRERPARILGRSSPGESASCLIPEYREGLQPSS